MSVIYYRLTNVTPLTNFVSAPGPGGAWAAAVNNLPAALNQLYVIFNGNTHNSYVGKADDLHNRFDSKQESAVHLGLDVSYMQNLALWYGDYFVWDTPTAAGGPPPPVVPTYNGVIPGHLLGALRPTVLARANIDNAPVAVDLEKILIRRYNRPDSPITYNTNTLMSRTPFTNTTGNPIHIIIDVVQGGPGGANAAYNYVINAGAAY